MLNGFLLKTTNASKQTLRAEMHISSIQDKTEHYSKCLQQVFDDAFSAIQNDDVEFVEKIYTHLTEAEKIVFLKRNPEWSLKNHSKVAIYLYGQILSRKLEKEKSNHTSSHTL